MEEIKYIGGAILLIGFFYYILIRAISTQNYKRKSFFIFIAGLVITLFFLGGIGYDMFKGYYNVLSKEIEYFSFLIVSVVYMVGVSLFYYIKGFSRQQQFQNNFKKTKSVPTIKGKNEYVYIIPKINDAFYLQKNTEKDGAFYKGIVLKFGNNEYFHDEIVKEYIVKNQLNITSYRYIGKAIKKEKKDNIFYCYRILLNDIPATFNNFESIDSYKLLATNIKDDDKKILFNSVINDNFEIEL